MEPGLIDVGTYTSTLLGYLAMVGVGLSLGLVGGGGGILTVPIMVFLFRVPAVLATSYSLFIVGLASAAGVWRYRERGLVDFRTAAIFGLPSLCTTLAIRRYLLPSLPASITLGPWSITRDELILVTFAWIMVGAALSMVYSPRLEGRPAVAGSERPSQQSVLPLIVLGLIVGLIAGFVGGGGGFLIVPALVLVGQMEMPLAVGTSLLVITANSATGFVTDLSAGVSINPTLLTVTTILAIGGIGAGTALGRRIKPQQLRKMFGWFLFAMATVILVTQCAGSRAHASTPTPRDTSAGSKVLLLHGMGRTSFSMRHMNTFLRNAGWQTDNWNYDGFFATVDESAQLLCTRIRTMTSPAERVHGSPAETVAGTRLHFVTHSLGYVIVRRARTLCPDIDPHLGRMAFLTPPAQGARLADTLAPWIGWFLQPLDGLRSGHWDRSGADADKNGESPYLAPLGAIQALVVFSRKDLLLEPQETQLNEPHARLESDGSHTFIMDEPVVQRVVHNFLTTGTLEEGGE